MKFKSNVKVLLASYNGRQWIAEQIKTILEQDNVNVHLYVSDDLSSDGTNLDESSNINANVTLLTPKKAGAAGANFFRLIKDVRFDTNCDYVAFSDQDDIWFNNKLETAISQLNTENVDAYSSNVLAFWSNGIKKLINKAQTQREFDFMFESAGPGCTFVLTKELALDLQLFLINHERQINNIALHDWFIYAFARSRGYKWFIDPEPHMLYRQHDSNVVGANFGVEAKLIRWIKLREGWLTKQAILIADILGYQEHWPIKRLKRFNMIDKCYLAINASKFRRRFRDQLAFAITLFFTKKT